MCKSQRQTAARSKAERPRARAGLTSWLSDRGEFLLRYGLVNEAEPASAKLYHAVVNGLSVRLLAGNRLGACGGFPYRLVGPDRVVMRLDSFREEMSTVVLRNEIKIWHISRI